MENVNKQLLDALKRYLDCDPTSTFGGDTPANQARAAIAAAEQAQQAEPVASGWIDPNNKTKKQFLPHIGEPVLFCHDGVTYYGIHTGGSFKTGQGVTARTFGTWDCQWMYPPAAAQKGGASC